ncbi:MAG TPA: DUF6320 domain-containing protein [Chitinophagaceae bacterium]|nr:DUF6320 domain-containing protein [Chitinophagaceae bacterium]
MIICKNCGVELEEGIANCPLCGQSAGSDDTSLSQIPVPEQKSVYGREMTQPQKQFTWEIVSLILLSGAIATFIVDFIISRRITWSELPMAMSLTIFSYISLFAFWRQRLVVQMTGGLMLSSLCLVVLDLLIGGIHWSTRLAIPLLTATTIVLMILIFVVRNSKYKGINLIAWIFLGAAILCLCIDGVLSIYKTGSFHLSWSIIAISCIVPVVLVLLFAHFRLKKGRSLEKTFHV